MAMSAPAAKAFSEPVMTMQPMASSASKSLSATPSSSTRASFRALRAWGRFKVMRPTLPRASTTMFSKVMGAPPVMRFRWRRRAAAEARGGRGLDYAIHLDESATGPIVGMGRRLVHVQHRHVALDQARIGRQGGEDHRPHGGRAEGGEFHHPHAAQGDRKSTRLNSS